MDKFKNKRITVFENNVHWYMYTYLEIKNM